MTTLFDRFGAHDVREAPFGGRGEVRVWNLLAQSHAAPFTAVLACELAPQSSVGKHHQAACAEIVVGLEGHGSARVDGQTQALEPGSVVHLPLGAMLEIDNTTDVPLRYLIIKAK